MHSAMADQTFTKEEEAAWRQLERLEIQRTELPQAEAASLQTGLYNRETVPYSCGVPILGHLIVNCSCLTTREVATAQITYYYPWLGSVTVSLSLDSLLLARLESQANVKTQGFNLRLIARNLRHGNLYVPPFLFTRNHIITKTI